MSAWLKLCPIDEIPVLGSRVMSRMNRPNIAIFRSSDNTVFAVEDVCPHKGGPLSQGIMHGNKVTCPLHGWNISLDTGTACSPDEGCARTFPTRLSDGVVWLQVSRD
ncbi:MAG: nitrite reductase small subunit NirD [Rhodocyclaceae bacterium]|nr:nitrite reductase small subunit NirD [Rhodocyclaceae bacterium]